MGKEGELLKAIKEKDSGRVQKLLSAAVKKKSQDESYCWQSMDSGHKIHVELRHINVNVQEPETGYTPLLLAVLKGMKEIAERLIFNCADVKAKDIKGNTALHLAVFHGRLDIVELLLFNDAEVNAQNEDGNTALHIACQAAIDQRVKIIKMLVRSDANVWTKNKYNLTPLDVSTQFGRNDAIVTLLELVPSLIDNRTALIEASIRGFKNSVELLLEYGISCNYFDENYGSTALHEAVRFNREDVVEILLAFQANPDLANLKKETARDLASQLPLARAEKMNKLFQAQLEKEPRIPKMLQRKQSPLTPRGTDSTFGIHKDYPELPNDLTWTQNRPRFCSSCTERNPNTHILDDNPRSFWVIPVLHDAWTILDLHYEHIITGITIFGWNSPQMIKTFQLQTSDSMEGPWTTVASFTCEMLGSTDPKEPAFPQKFSYVTVRTRYIRLYIVDNHDGSCICFQGIKLHGASCRVIETLQDCGLYRAADSFIFQDMNTWEKFLDVSQTTVDALVSDAEKKSALWEAIYRGRRIMYPMTVLTWLMPPASSTFIGESLPDFSVQSDPGATEVIELVAQGAQLAGNTCQRLSSPGKGKPSVATFSNISISPVGMFLLLVKGTTTEITLAAPRPTEVRPEVRSESDISTAFDEIQQMLSEVQATLPPDK